MPTLGIKWTDVMFVKSMSKVTKLTTLWREIQKCFECSATYARTKMKSYIEVVGSPQFTTRSSSQALASSL